MKNITLSVDDEVYHAARVEAARRQTSLSALVRNFLTGLPAGGSKSDTEIAERNRLMEALLRRTAHFRVGNKPTREEMHAR
jgi:hypothetical protein